MSSRGCFTAIFAVLLCGTCASAQDVGNRDTLRYGCYTVSATGADSFGVPLFVYSDNALGALTAVYRYESTLLTFSSATLGSRLAGAPTAAFVVLDRPEEKAFALSWVGSPELSIPGSLETWHFATVYFRNDSHLPCPGLRLDSSSLAPGLATSFGPVEGGEFVPDIWKEYTPGYCERRLCMAVDEPGETPEAAVERFRFGSYPNPFNSGAILEVSASRTGIITIEIFDILGRRVRKLVDSELPAGDYEFAWDGRDDSGGQTASGVYLARVISVSSASTIKLVLLR